MANHIVGSFTIKITKRQQQYEIQALNSKNEIVAEPHPFIWTPNAEIKRTLNLFQDPIKAQMVLLPQFTNLGQALYQAVFTPNIANALGRIQASVKEPNSIRIKLLVDPPELANLPWEIMHDNHDFIGLNSDYPLVRGFRDTSTIPEFPVHGKLKILYAWANPEDQIDLEGLQESAEKIKALLSKNKKIHFEILEHATRENLQSKLDEDYHIFCFAGHAGHSENKGIFLETDDKASDKVPSLALARILQGKHVRLVFLAACDTAKTASLEDASFAESLIRDGNNAKAKLSSVVAMQYITTNDLDNPTTEPLTARFFEALASFRPVDIALSEARKSILDEHRQNVGVTRDEHRQNVSFTRDVFAPVLYLQSESSNLFRRAFNWPAIIFAIAFVIAASLGLLALSNAVNASEGETVARATAEAEATQRFYAQEREVEARGTAVAEATQRAYAQAEVTVQAEIGATAVSAQIAEEQQKRIVLAHELAAESQGINAEYPQLGVLLAIESIFATYSHNEPSTIEAKQSLYDALAEIGGTPLLEEIAPNEHVFDIDLSPNGQWLALIAANENESTSYEYDYHQSTIRLWDIKNNGFISEPLILNNVSIGEDNVTFSADNQWLITTDRACINGGTTTLWDLSQPISTNYVLEGCQIASSPDGRWLITAPDTESYRSEIYLWDLFNVDTFAKPIVFGNRHKAVFSHNNQWLATASETEVAIWRLSVISLYPDPIVLPHHDDNVVSLAFSPDDNWIVVGTNVVGEQGGNMTLWNVSELLESAPVPTLFKSDIDVFSEIKFSPDSSKLFANSTNNFDENSRFFLWDIENINSDPITIIRNVNEQASTVFSPDSHWLATVGNNNIQIWDISPSESIATTPMTLSGINTNLTADTGLLTSSSAAHIIFSPNNRWLSASSTSDETVHLWDISATSYYDQPITLSGHEGNVSIFFSSDNRWLITSSTSDKAVRLWDLQHLQNLRGEIVGNGYLTVSNHGNSVSELAISPDGNWLVATGGTAGTNGNVNRVWNLQEKDSPPIDINIQAKSVSSLTYSPDGMWLATGTKEGFIDLWDTSLPNWDDPIFTLANENEVLDIKFSPDGQWLAAGGNDGRLDFWDLNTQTVKNILNINGEKITSLTFSPDGQWLAIGSDDDVGATSSKATIRILDMETQQIIHALTDLGTYIRDMEFSPDGQWFAASTGFYHDWYGSVSLWKSSELGESPQVFTGKSLAFSPDSQWLALEGGGTIYEHEPSRLWSLSSDDNLVSDFINLTGNSSFGHVIFSPDGNWLITGHFEEIRLWPLQMDTLVDLACRTVGRNLTFLEWETYLPQENYRKTCFN